MIGTISIVPGSPAGGGRTPGGSCSLDAALFVGSPAIQIKASMM